MNANDGRDVPWGSRPVPTWLNLAILTVLLLATTACLCAPILVALRAMGAPVTAAKGPDAAMGSFILAALGAALTPKLWRGWLSDAKELASDARARRRERGRHRG